MPNKPGWQYRGRLIAPSVAIEHIGKVHELSEGHKACILLWLQNGPVQFRKEIKEGKLVPEARQVVVWMAEFILRLKTIRGVENDVQRGSPEAA